MPDDTCAEMKFPYSDRDSIYPAIIKTCPGTLSDWTIFEIDMLGLLPADAPEGYGQASGCFRFQAVEGGEIIGPLDIILTYWGDPDSLMILKYDSTINDWIFPDAEVFFESESTLVISTMDMGI